MEEENLSLKKSIKEGIEKHIHKGSNNNNRKIFTIQN
jgi:hypothetical protein